MLKLCLPLAWIVFIMSSVCCFADEQPAVPSFSAELSTMLASPDVSIRREAIRAFSQYKPEKDDPELVVKLIKQALQDSDGQVRSAGANMVYGIAFFNPAYWLKLRHMPVKVDISKDAELQALLVNRMGDSEEKVREGVIAALALAYPPDPEIEKRLVAMFPKEPALQVRDGIVDAIAISKYSSKGAIGVLMAGLQDTAFAVQNSSASAIGKLRPEGGLEKLAERLDQPSSLGVQGQVLTAILAYGAKAKLYLRSLEDELAKQQQMVANLQQAIAKLKSLDDHKDPKKKPN